jgi:toxin YoeB
MYRIKYEKKALKQLRLLKSQKHTLQKVSKIIQEISIDPYSPTHKFERLKHTFKGFCSKRVDKKNRIIYRVEDETIIVLIISILGHYEE